MANIPLLSPDDLDDARAAGNAAFEAGRHTDALAAWSTDGALTDGPAGDRFWVTVALAMRRAQRPRALAQLRHTLMERGNPDVQVHLQYALLLSESGELDAALEALDEAMGLSGPAGRVDVMKVRATILTQAGRFSDATDAALRLEDFHAPNAKEAGRFCLALIERKQYSHRLRQAPNSEKLDAYWLARKEAVYIHVIKEIVAVIAKSANTVADIGSNATPILDYFPDICRKFSVDPGSPYEGPGVEAIREDFFVWESPAPIEIISCFQVMEHVPDPETFAAHLLELGEVCMVSVPYKEAPGLNPGHIHSTIDETTIESWFKRKPNYQYVARELDGGERIISVFDRHDDKSWPTLCGHCEQGLKFRFRWSKRGFSPA